MHIPWSDWRPQQAPDFRQALRTVVACVVVFAAYRLLQLPQGFWAVLTVVLITQGTIGGTLGAANERLLGTMFGAIVGGIAAVLFPADFVSLAIALCISVGISMLAATAIPRLRVAPLTAAIMLLSHPADLPAAEFALDRILEIALGGAVGIAASVLIFPVHSGELFNRRAARVLNQMRDLLRLQADRLDRHENLPVSQDYLAIRKALAGMEQGLAEADREHATHLGARPIPAPLPRTLWRVRNDLMQISRAMEQPLEERLACSVNPDAARRLRAYAAIIEDCARALGEAGTVAQRPQPGETDTLKSVLETLRHAGADEEVDTDTLARIFGLAFGLDQLGLDLGVLADLIDQMSGLART